MKTFTNKTLNSPIQAEETHTHTNLLRTYETFGCETKKLRILITFSDHDTGIHIKHRTSNTYCVIYISFNACDVRYLNRLFSLSHKYNEFNIHCFTLICLDTYVFVLTRVSYKTVVVHINTTIYLNIISSTSIVTSDYITQ